MFDKKGVSPVIATVLLLLLTLVIVSILSIFVIPFVQKNLQGGGDCFEILGDLKFDDSAYNCRYTNPDPDPTTPGEPERKNTGFSVRVDSDQIGGFKVSLFSQGRADQFDIISGMTSDNIRMIEKDWADPTTGEPFPLEVPDEGGIRTYVAKGTYERVEINPILKSGKLCDEKQRIDVVICIDPTVISKIDK